MTKRQRWQRLKQKMNELKSKMKAKLPKMLKGSWRPLACMLLCAIIISWAMSLLPMLLKLKTCILILAGRYMWPKLERLLGKKEI